MPHRIPDSMTKSGAEELVAKIKFYWAQRGYSPVIRIEPEHSGFVIRSELRGAMPPADKGIPA